MQDWLKKLPATAPPFSARLPLARSNQISPRWPSPPSAPSRTSLLSPESSSDKRRRRSSFSPRGSVSISVTGAKAASSLSKPDPLQLGFFLLSDETLFEAIYEQPLPTEINPNPESSPECVLSSPYVTPLFTFAELDGGGHYNKTFPITHPDEYNLFFANFALETVVTMSGLLVTRTFYCISAAEDQYYICTGGTPHGWDVMFYLFQLVKGVILFTVIALIGTGWLFLKPIDQLTYNISEDPTPNLAVPAGQGEEGAHGGHSYKPDHSCLLVIPLQVAAKSSHSVSLKTVLEGIFSPGTGSHCSS